QPHRYARARRGPKTHQLRPPGLPGESSGLPVLSALPANHRTGLCRWLIVECVCSIASKVLLFYSYVLSVLVVVIFGESKSTNQAAPSQFLHKYRDITKTTRPKRIQLNEK